MQTALLPRPVLERSRIDLSMWQKRAADLGPCFRICAKSRFSHGMVPPLLADGDRFLTYLAVATLGCPCSVYDYSIHWPDVGITHTEYLSPGTIGNLQE